jgi:hypothetical protein
MYLLPSLKNFFHSHFTLNLLKIYKLFLCKTAYYVKRQNNSKIFLEKFAFYGLDMELEPEPEP